MFKPTPKPVAADATQAPIKSIKANLKDYYKYYDKPELIPASKLKGMTLAQELSYESQELKNQKLFEKNISKQVPAEDWNTAGTSKHLAFKKSPILNRGTVCTEGNNCINSSSLMYRDAGLKDFDYTWNPAFKKNKKIDGFKDVDRNTDILKEGDHLQFNKITDEQTGKIVPNHPRHSVVLSNKRFNPLTGKPEYLVADSHGGSTITTTKYSHDELTDRLRNGYSNNPFGGQSYRYVNGSISRLDQALRDSPENKKIRYIKTQDLKNIRRFKK